MPGATPVAEQVNWLFLDMNSYFASVEQQVQPHLRGKPTAVVTVDADSTVCIAASYEAKAFGVSTGTALGEARKKCPDLNVVVARHEIYVDYHEKIKAAVEQNCLHISKIISIDEMECQLRGRDRQIPNAQELARQVKQAIRSVGETLRCSVGIAPNRFLAKIASNMKKPDGLVTLTANQLPQILFSLKPRDLPGIGHQMEKRLLNQGIATMEQLWRLDMDQMTQLWGGVLGTRFWLKLRGIDFDERESHQSSISHQHVLPPDLRTHEQACAVGKKLLHKAAVRLRQAKLWTSAMTIFVLFSKSQKSKGDDPSGYWLHYDRPVWEASLRFPSCHDTMTLVNVFQEAWKECPKVRPVMVSVALLDLIPENMRNMTLFDKMYGGEKFDRLAQVMDSVNAKYGSTTLYLGSIHKVREAAPPRIAFKSIPDMNLK
ncbi:MAG TPA: DNA polymerase [Candidatus Polarisedimenticolia bacterium]|jgi:DNA polymerase-4|nr:DNA polymerase [Candidatus Polarisedimenticolia bacterium]